MKKSPLSAVLVALLSVSVLATAVLSCWYVQSIRQMRRLQVQVNAANYNRNFIQRLANDAAEYSKNNTRMEVLL